MCSQCVVSPFPHVVCPLLHTHKEDFPQVCPLLLGSALLLLPQFLGSIVSSAVGLGSLDKWTSLPGVLRIKLYTHTHTTHTQSHSPTYTAITLKQRWESHTCKWEQVSSLKLQVTNKLHVPMMFSLLFISVKQVSSPPICDFHVLVVFCSDGWIHLGLGGMKGLQNSGV